MKQNDETNVPFRRRRALMLPAMKHDNVPLAGSGIWSVVNPT